MVVAKQANTMHGVFFMAVLTYTEQLEQIDTAITAILTGAQSYSIGNRSKTSGDLRTLMDERKRLQVLADRETDGGGIRVRGVTPVTD
jgi:hypothetical protein